MVGNEHRARALALEHRVGGDRRAVHDAGRLAEHTERTQAGENGLLGRGGCREFFVGAHMHAVEQHKIGEGAAGIDADDGGRQGGQSISTGAGIGPPV